VLHPPLLLWVKVNVDTGYSGPNQKAISRIIVEDELGKILGSGYRFHTWVNMIFMAERWWMQKLCREVKACHFKFSPRGCNIAAHAMAVIGQQGLSEEVPPKVHEIVAED
ncbi:hypothetical protein Golob_004111, partial [Gossypium lobatum]|nr:hypothetical protein [Gossypium lobatum]